MKMLTVIYDCVDPRSNEVRYVGKAIVRDEESVVSALDRRLRKHLERRDSRSHRVTWFQSLVEAGVRPVISILEVVDGSEWPEVEMFYIRYFRFLGCRLVNATEGGEGSFGYTHDEIARAKIKEARSRQIISPESQRKGADTRRGHKTSALTIKRIGDAQRGRKKSPEQIEKIAVKLRGRKLSDEHRAKISKKSAEYLANPDNLAAHTARVRESRGTPESRAKTSAQGKIQADSDDWQLRRPDVVVRRIAGIRASRTNPVYLERASVGRKATWAASPQYWWTDGVEERRLTVMDVSPDGWYKGRSASHIEKMAAGAVVAWQRKPPQFWWTNGIGNRRLASENVPPEEGWYRGKVRRKSVT